MQLKEYQHETLTVVRRYLERLYEWRSKAADHPDLEIDFPAKAWEKAEIPRAYDSRDNGIGEPLPNFCLKIPTGGGKTLLAVKTIDLANMIYRRRRTGLVLWIVPTTQIYRQTIRSLKDRDHPYRQHLDMASGGRTAIREKTDRFSPQEVAENLVVLMLMLPSANRQTKETLKVFKDSGGFSEFFPTDDDYKGHEELLSRYPNLDTFDEGVGFWGRQVKTSLGNTLRTLSPLIVLDEGHKAYSEGAQQTLRGFNPCMIVELSATPVRSNVLVEISGRDLLKEEMVKLDMHVRNKLDPDWRTTLLDGVGRRNLLEEKAVEYEGNTGEYIRPICLIQVERTGKEQRSGKYIHSEDVREHLIETMGIAEEEIAVKTSEKDELKDVDDLGGLMSRGCPVRYIVTKQALQEGWDCSFAYVLVILTNPSSKNALTQLCGRILRQPYARKTGVAELDESYVFCFRQRADAILKSIQHGFAKEGLGDLKGHIVSDGEDGDEGGETGRLFEIRDEFKEAAERTILPVFVVRDGRGWRPVNYHVDIESRIPWDKADLKPVLQLTLSGHEEKDVDLDISLTDDEHRLIHARGKTESRVGGIRLDTVFMTRQIVDIVPNPWRAHEFAAQVLNHHRNELGGGEETERILSNNFVYIIEELRRQLEAEKDRLAEEVFHEMIHDDLMRFLIIGEDFKWTFPKKIEVKKTSKILTRADGGQLLLSLYEKVPEDDFNDPEKRVAWYLEDQQRLFFWFRNRERKDYSIQGWRRHRIYPDFIFTVAQESDDTDYKQVYVVETKGIHLKDNNKTRYIQKVFTTCTQHAKQWNRQKLGSMKDKVVRFEVVAEDEWKRRLTEIMHA